MLRIIRSNGVKRVLKSMLCLVLVLALVATSSGYASFAEGAGEISGSVKVGVAKTDITGPITEISTGYNSLGDLMEGLLTRLYARAFVIESNDSIQAIVSAELVHMTESIKPGVLSKLKADGYGLFTEENVMLTATHCHSSTSNTSWYALYDLINGVPGFDDESYEVIVKGIAEAIEQAFDNRREGSVSLVYGETGIMASNRSADAYLANKNASDHYNFNSDGTFSYEVGLEAAKNAYNHEMAGLVFTDASGKDIGFINFFASHGTSNGIENKLVASDHKGYAALEVEKSMGEGFVAAFAQADSGDTSPNAVDEKDYHSAFLRPNQVDTSLDVIENQIVYGEQEAKAAMTLITDASRTKLTGDFFSNYTVVDFSDISVDTSYVGEYYMPYDDLSAGSVKTSEPCIGAGIIAGDEEGAPVDNAEEGAVKHSYVYDEETGTYTKVKVDFNVIDLGGLEKMFGPLWPAAMKLLKSDKYDEEQMEKVVCLAVGDYMQKNQPLQIMRMGEAAVVGVPFELTFEQANRIKAVLLKTLEDAGVKKVILATHANSYSQYVTTREEYAAQHYEGSTCLFGPWSGAALTQELDKLAQGIVKGEHAARDESSPKLIAEEPSGLLYTSVAKNDTGYDVTKRGTVKKDVEKKVYAEGEWVTATFTGVNTRHITTLKLANDSRVNDYTFMEVQRKNESTGEWETYLTDESPYTTFRSSTEGFIVYNYDATVGWLIKGEADTDEQAANQEGSHKLGTYKPGTYRLAYNGIAKVKKWGKISKIFYGFTDDYETFTAYSSEFEVR